MASESFTIVSKRKDGTSSTTVATTSASGHYETSLGATALLMVDISNISIYRNARARDERAPWIRIQRHGNTLTISEADAPKDLAAKKKKASSKKDDKEKKKEKDKPKKRKAEGAPAKEKPAKKAKHSTHA